MRPRAILVCKDVFICDNRGVAFSTEMLLVMTRSVHCLTLSRGRRAENDFGQQRLNIMASLLILRYRRKLSSRKDEINVWEIANFSSKYFPLTVIAFTVMFVPLC